MLLSSNVNNVMQVKNIANAEVKCQMSCLSKNINVHSAFIFRDSDGLKWVVFSFWLKWWTPIIPKDNAKIVYTQHVTEMDSKGVCFEYT